jgi:hypothetical protein
MSKIKTKKTIVFNETETNNMSSKDINVLIRELKEKDKLEEIEREKRIIEIFKQVVLDGK